MRKIIITLIAITVLLLFFTSCDKYHRDRYTGTWEFETKQLYYNRCDTNTPPCDNPPFGNLIKKDNIYYTGKITLGSGDNALIIQYTENDKIEAWVDKDGYIFSKADFYHGKYSTGEFAGKNKMNLLLIWGLGTLPFGGDTDNRIDQIVGTKKGRK